MDSKGTSTGERDSGTDSNKANLSLMEGTEADSKGIQNLSLYQDLQQNTSKYMDNYPSASAVEENILMKEAAAHQHGSVAGGMTSDTFISRQTKPVLEIGNSLTQSYFMPYGKDIHSSMGDERKMPSSACLTMSLGLCNTKGVETDGNSLSILNLPGMFGSSFEPYCDGERNQMKLPGMNPIRAKPRQLLPKQPQMHQSSCLEAPKPPQMHSLSRPETPKETMQGPIRVARPPVEGRGRNQLLPRYWPRITDQELQQITAGDSNSTITPLFEKMLSASDAGRIGRLVLPKACAEAYFPPISQPEGLPLKIQDISGKDWTFQFRFWPNNNSRMYVLEGVTPCIQSMQLQAGDTVTFSRLDPEGKLVMGYRRAPSSLCSQMRAVLMFGGQMPVIKVGRMAGQFAKPRSDDFEVKDGVTLPSYRGDNINGDEFNEKSRIPDPNRMVKAYSQAAATLNLLRSFATGGYAAMQRVTHWNLDFTSESEQGSSIESEGDIEWKSNSADAGVQTFMDWASLSEEDFRIKLKECEKLIPNFGPAMLCIEERNAFWMWRNEILKKSLKEFSKLVGNVDLVNILMQVRAARRSSSDLASNLDDVEFSKTKLDEDDASR